MNKTEFINTISAKTDIPMNVVKQVVNAYTDVILDTLAAGDKVSIANFGSYEIKVKPERQGFNPITKQPITIAESKSPTLKFAKAVKDQFND